MSVRLVICDPDISNPEAPNRDTWQSQFEETESVELRAEHVLETTADAILVPGNAFGFLDGGLELAVTEKYGFELQDTLQAKIAQEFDGELLVGQAATLESSGPLLVYAPIWRAPQDISKTVNVFLAVQGACNALGKLGGGPKTLAMPPLGLGDGGMDLGTSGRQTRVAFETATGQRGRGNKNLTQVQRRDRKLKTPPGLRRAEKEDARRRAFGDDAGEADSV